MTLYNCKSEGNEYRVTKFDSDLNVESTYLTTLRECQCPAGHRDTCRHRLMLPIFLKKRDGADRGQWLLDYDRKQWVRASTEDDYELVCVHGHDRCDGGAFEGCPYCERRHVRERSDFENEVGVAVDEDEVEIIEPNATVHNMHQHMGGVHAKDVTPKPINLLSLAEGGTITGRMGPHSGHITEVEHSPQPKPLRRI